MDVKEMSEADLKVTSSRGVWDKEGILDFAKELNESYPGKVLGMPLETIGNNEGFFNKFYRGTKKIKYIAYYCKKHLTEAFRSLEINADVRTTKNTLLVSLRSQAQPVEEEDTEE